MMEHLKEVLRARFTAEHEVWLKAEKRRQEEEEARALEERRRAEEEARLKAAEAASIERDRQVAMWHQAQMDAEARGLPPPPQPSFSPIPPSAPPSNPSSIEHGLALDAQRPPYNPSLYELPSVPSSSPSAPPASAPPYNPSLYELPSVPSSSPSAPSSAGSPAPTFD